MIKSQLALLRRELWEHRSLYVTPAVIALAGVVDFPHGTGVRWKS